MRKSATAPEANVEPSKTLHLPGCSSAAPLSPRDIEALRHYQIDAVGWLRARHRALLADEMGTGKTGAALRAIPTTRAIVVCPAGLRRNWLVEANGPLSPVNGAPACGWRPDLRARIARSREDWVPGQGELVIGSYDGMPPRISQAALLGADLSEDTTVLLDEVHYAKNEEAQRTKKVRALVRQAAFAWGLTGTPLPNRPLDLFGVLDTLELVTDTFESWTKFISLMQGWQDSYGNWKFGRRRGDEWVIASDRLERAAKLVAPVMLRRLKSDVLSELPPKVYSEEIVSITPPEDAGKLLRETEKKWSLYVAKRNLETGSETSNEMPPFDMLSGAMKELATAKIPAMLAAVERFEEAELPLLVFAAHVEPIHVLSRRAGWGVIHGATSSVERARMVMAFQDGQLRGLGLTIQAGGVGLTLTRASNVLFVDRAWNPSDNTQAEDRAHRIGQKGQSVNILLLIADHVLDRHLSRILTSKQRTIQAVIG